MLHISYGADGKLENSSFDLTAVHFAFEGEGDHYSLSEPIKLTVNPEDNGSNSFEPGDGTVKQFLMKKKKTDIEIAHYLNNILLSFA